MQLTLEGVDVHALARVDLPAENKPRELVLDHSLDCTPERTRAELAVVALAREQLDCVVAELDLDLLRPQVLGLAGPVRQDPHPQRHRRTVMPLAKVLLGCHVCLPRSSRTTQERGT